MNSEYPHAGKHLNKPIIRDLIPLVYPGEGYFTVKEFWGMIEKYHMENGGENWIVRWKTGPIRSVLDEYVAQHGWECKNEKKPFRYGLPKKGTQPITSKDYPVTLTLGSGAGAVYVYYYPRDKELAESKKESFWQCKVGMTESDVDTRIKAQRTTASYEKPEIGLKIRTDNPRCLEKAIHAILELKGRKIDTDGGGNEWFLTSPTEVMIIQILINGI
jgi:hypothetical protein